MLCVMYYIYGEGRDDNDNGIYSSYNWIDDQLEQAQHFNKLDKFPQVSLLEFFLDNAVLNIIRGPTEAIITLT